ncbi:MAG: ribosome silencing factor [Elusimicrobia bacterium]|nr:ribosome silencing factor [Elusimicrobiota bacterium]
MNSLETACRCARAADSRKAENILVLDVRGISMVTDYFVIASGFAEPHLKAIRDEVEKQLRDDGVRPRGIDGVPHSHWVVMDYVDVLVHIFSKERRDFYCLEQLWGDAQRVEWTAEGPSKDGGHKL